MLKLESFIKLLGPDRVGSYLIKIKQPCDSGGSLQMSSLLSESSCLSLHGVFELIAILLKCYRSFWYFM